MYYKNGNKYEGDWNNDVREGKGILYMPAEINMKVIGRMTKKMEKGYIISKAVINMMVIG